MRKPILLILATCASPAFACQPMRGPQPIAARALDRIAASEIAASDAIVDAVVGPWTRQGLILEVRRTWKGKRWPRILVTPDGCGPSFPARGAWVRTLLTRDPTGWWLARDPSLGGELADHRRLDRLIDRRLGSVRPRYFQTIASAPPPPPPR